MAIEPKAYGYPKAEITANKLPIWQRPLSRFSVEGPNDWKVSILSSIDRGIRIEAGTGSGDAVTDVTFDYETMSLPTPPTATAWYLIVRRRNWSGTGTSTLVAIRGTDEKKLPPRQDIPGEESDQPLALVRVTQKDRPVQEIIDLRCWASNGGVEVVDKLAMGYLETPGAEVKLGNELWRCEPKGNGVWGWGVHPYRTDGVAYTPTWSGFEYRGDTHISKGMYWVNGDRVTVKAMIQSGRNPSLGLATVGFSLPPGLPVGADFLASGSGVMSTFGTSGQMRQVVTLAGPGQSGATVWVDRNPFVTPGSAGFSWGEGHSFHVQIDYRL